MRQTFTIAALALTLLAPAVGLAQSFAIDGDQLTRTVDGGEPTQITLSCTPSAHLVHQGTLYAACGDAGVLVIDVMGETPKELGRRDMGGAVTDIVLIDGVAWAQIQRLEARPVVQGQLVADVVIIGGAEPSADSKVEPTPPQAEVVIPEAEVVEYRAESVIIGLGTDHGIKRGSRVEIFVREAVEFGGEATFEETRVLIGKVKAVSKTRAEVKLGLNERVPVGALARATDLKTTGNPMAPPRVGGVWELGFTARPFLALGTFGFGTISDATVRRRFEGPWSAEFRLEPLGLGFADEGNVVAASGNVIGSYDTRLFSVGLGIGWAAVNDSPGSDFLGADLEGSEPAKFERVRSGLSIAQSVRLGAQDGLHLSVLNSFLFYSDEFNYGGTTVTMQIPAGDSLWVFARGGGGSATGYGFGEVGLRVRVLGSGDSGSLYLSPSVGGGGLFGERDCDDYDGCVEDVSYGGPLVGLGLEWRQ